MSMSVPTLLILSNDEENLATASGMNRFTSAIVLPASESDDATTSSPWVQTISCLFDSSLCLRYCKRS